MKSLLDVTLSILLDCGMLCGVNPNRDLLEITRRVGAEGQSFLTITLPTLASGLELGLKLGRWSPSHATAFKCRKRRSLPQFLGGFFDQIFDADGVLREKSDEQTRSIWGVRQVCRLLSKLNALSSDKRVARAVTRFLSVETEVSNHVVPKDLAETFEKVSAIVWSDILHSGSDLDRYNEYHPRHGRGTTAQAIRGNAKWLFLEWPKQLDEVFPFSEFGVSNILNDDAMDRVQSIDYPLPGNETTSVVVPVPKTMKTPRIIAKEPVAYQFMQQAIADWLRPRIETRGRFTAGHVNFTDQTINNNLARAGSRGGYYATLDLSDASDRVSLSLVERMLKVSPSFLREVLSCRSSRATLPDGTICHLKKFASMGSALCFPIEAVAFFIAIISSKLHRNGRTPTPSSVLRASHDVYVYGDDMVVSAHMAPSVVIDLELFGFKVNAAKSFWTGKFRESCGGDYYDGTKVTPVYLRRSLPNNRADVHSIASSVSFANQLYWAGCWKTAQLVRNEVESVLGTLPSVAKGDEILGWESFSNARSTHGWSKQYQRPKSRGYVLKPVRRVDVIDGDSALLKCFTVIGNPDTSREHLSTSVRFGNLALKRRWI